MNVLMDTNRNRHQYTSITSTDAMLRWLQRPSKGHTLFPLFFVFHMRLSHATMSACRLEQFRVFAKCNTKFGFSYRRDVIYSPVSTNFERAN